MKTIPKKIRPKVVPKLSIGGIISNATTGAITGSAVPGVGTVLGGLAGAATGLISHLGEQDSLKRQEAARRELIRRNKNITEAARFAEFNPNGYAMNNYYSKGGTPKLQTGGVPDGEEYGKVYTKSINSNVKKDKISSNNVPFTVENVLKSVAHTPRTFNEIADAVYSLAYTGYSPFSKKHWEIIGDKFKDAAVTSQKELDDNYNPATITDNIARGIINVKGGKLTSRIAGKALQTPVAQKIIKGVGGTIDDVIKYYLPKKGFDPRTLKTIPQAVDAPLRPNSYSYTPNSFGKLSNPVFKRITAKNRLLPQKSTFKAKYPSSTKVIHWTNSPEVSRSLNNRFKPKQGKLIIPPSTVSRLLKNTDNAAALRIYHANSPYSMPYEDFVKIINNSPTMAKKVFNAAGIKGLAKGGTVSMSGVIPGIKTDATEIPIAPNAIQVKTNKKGTDKIKANIKGSPAMVDNNELIVNMSDGTPVVISDDLGEVDKYKSLLKKGYNPNKLNDVFGKRAIARQNNTIKLEEGGTPFYTQARVFNPGGEDTYKELYLGDYPIEMLNQFENNTIDWNPKIAETMKKAMSFKKDGISNPTSDSYKTFETRPYNDPYDWTKPGATLEKQASTGAGLYGGITPKDIIMKGNPDILKAVYGEDLSKVPNLDNWTENDTRKLTSYIETNYGDQLNKKDGKYGHDYHSILTRMGDIKTSSINQPVPTMTPISTKNTTVSSIDNSKLPIPTKPSLPSPKEPFLNSEDKTNLALAGAQTLGNVVSMFEAQNQKVPKPVLNTAITEDVFKNRPIFEQHKSTLKGMEVAAKNNIKLNSSNANSYIARMSNLIPVVQSGMGQLASQEAADRNAIYDRNNRALNATAMQNNSIINNYQNANFAKNLDDIQNRNTVMTNAIGSVQGVLDNKKARDMESMGLRALAKSYGIEWNGDPEDIRKQMIDKLINGHLD